MIIFLRCIVNYNCKVAILTTQSFRKEINHFLLFGRSDKRVQAECIIYWACLGFGMVGCLAQQFENSELALRLTQQL